MEVYTKLSKCGEHVLLAACDEELLGQVLKDGKIEESTVVNLVGPNIVKKAIEKGLVHPEAVLDICGIPHAQILKV
ncbi:MAG: DUF424 family protein [Candidatus Bathyarchaeota archaeon]